MKVFRQIIFPGVFVPVFLSIGLWFLSLSLMKFWQSFFTLPIFRSEFFVMIFSWFVYYGLYFLVLWPAARQSRKLPIVAGFLVLLLSLLVFDFTNSLILGLWNQWKTTDYGYNVDYSFLTGPIFFRPNYMLFSQPLSAGIMIMAALCLERLRNYNKHKKDEIFIS